MKILIVHRYFWPDIANCGQILWHVAKHLQSEGHELQILTSLPSRNIHSNKIYAPKFEIIENIMIRRLKLSVESNSVFKRIINAIKLGFFTNYLAFRNNYDVILSTSVPSVTGALFSAMAAYINRARFFYFCMDVHPEVGKISGDYSNFFFYKLLEKLDNWSCSRADTIIVHSLDMKNSLLCRNGGYKFKVDIINNFSVPSETSSELISNFNLNIKKNKLTIIFIGNLGRFQDLEMIIKAMALIKSRQDIVLIIIGDGVFKEDLIIAKKKTDANVIFYNYQPVKIVKDALQQADLGLVSLKANMFKYAYPGKVMTYLEQGLPIIAKVELESELVKKMQNERYGFFAPNDIYEIAKIFVDLADDSSWKLPMRASALNASRKYFSKKKILEKWSDVMRLKI